MKTIVLHIGYRKTGSSAFQHMLHASQDTLQSQGILYPTPSCPFPAHQDLAWSLFRKTPWYADREYIFDDTVAHYKRQLEDSPCENIILSSEDFSRLDVTPTALLKLKDTFSEFTMKVVGWKRSPLLYLLSDYLHNLYIKREATSFCDHIATNEELFTVSFEKRFQIFQDIFGYENCRLFTYAEDETTNRETIASFFSEYFGTDMPEIYQHHHRINSSINPVLADAIRLLNASDLADDLVAQIKGHLMSASPASDVEEKISKLVPDMTLADFLRTLK